MVTKRQHHTREYKIEAVRLASSGDEPVSTVASELGIRVDALYRSKRELQNEPAEAFRGATRAATAGFPFRRLLVE